MLRRPPSIQRCGFDAATSRRAFDTTTGQSHLLHLSREKKLGNQERIYFLKWSRIASAWERVTTAESAAESACLTACTLPKCSSSRRVVFSPRPESPAAQSSGRAFDVACGGR